MKCHTVSHTQVRLGYLTSGELMTARVYSVQSFHYLVHKPFQFGVTWMKLQVRADRKSSTYHRVLIHGESTCPQLSHSFSHGVNNTASNTGNKSPRQHAWKRQLAVYTLLKHYMRIYFLALCDNMRSLNSHNVSYDAHCDPGLHKCRWCFPVFLMAHSS